MGISDFDIILGTPFPKLSEMNLSGTSHDPRFVDIREECEAGLWILTLRLWGREIKLYSPRNYYFYTIPLYYTGVKSRYREEIKYVLDLSFTMGNVSTGCFGEYYKIMEGHLNWIFPEVEIVAGYFRKVGYEYISKKMKDDIGPHVPVDQIFTMMTDLYIISNPKPSGFDDLWDVFCTEINEQIISWNVRS